jgi:hypothetical protein
MVDELDDRAIRVFAVKAPCPVTVRAGRGLDGDAPGLKELMPGVDLLGARKDKADMIEALGSRRCLAFGGAVQGEIVPARAEVHIIGIGAPLDLHTQKIHIEALARFELVDRKGNMAQTAGGNRVFHGSLAQAASSCSIASV